MYVIKYKCLFENEILMCRLIQYCVRVYNDVIGEWNISYYYHTKTIYIKIGDIFYDGIDPNLIDSSGDFYEKMEQIIDMIRSGSVNKELCDYLKLVIKKISLRYAIIVDHVYVYDENDNSEYMERPHAYNLKLKLTQRLNEVHHINESIAYNIIKTQVFNIFASTLYTNIKSARK